jgi:alkanesulfonate monooxygenase SsuD/methylene tetrahydromethanopterin reductase-like flavin-dependent oxidoreductase (luciferase family)
MRERVEAMKALWTQEEAEYHGEFVDFDPVWQWPKPFQKPHPPVMIGGMGERVVERVREYGNGWFPQPGRMPDDDSFIERVARHRGEFEMSAFGAKADPALIERYEEAGVTRTVFWVQPRPREETEGYLDKLSEKLGL